MFSEPCQGLNDKKQNEKKNPMYITEFKIFLEAPNLIITTTYLLGKDLIVPVKSSSSSNRLVVPTHKIP